jgi:hypothetical protein
VILGSRNRGSSLTDLVFAMAVFCCDRDTDCAKLESPELKSGVGALAIMFPEMFRLNGRRKTFCLSKLYYARAGRCSQPASTLVNLGFCR